MTTDAGAAEPAPSSDTPAPAAPAPAAPAPRAPAGTAPPPSARSHRPPSGGSGRDRRDSDDRGGRPDRRRSMGHGRKAPMFVPAEVATMDYKDVDRLRRLVSDRGRIEPRRKTGLTAKDQRKLTLAIKRARFVALLPYTAAHLRSTAEFRQASRAARYDAPRPPAAPDASAPDAAAPDAAAPDVVTPVVTPIPAVEAPAPEAPAAEAPPETAAPAAEAAAVEAPTAEAPADEASTSDAPTDETPAPDASDPDTSDPDTSA